VPIDRRVRRSEEREVPIEPTDDVRARNDRRWSSFFEPLPLPEAATDSAADKVERDRVDDERDDGMPAGLSDDDDAGDSEADGPEAERDEGASGASGASDASGASAESGARAMTGTRGRERRSAGDLTKRVDLSVSRAQLDVARVVACRRRIRRAETCALP
jgi:hypothetical protein